ncbi:hypothetical protein DPMN_192586 [Dreissena polymorpha]|uniref:EGF-like domain-containing protein n=1 Tax=Dreissena polymorpha TaxID=45954 RepID=A0A9D4BFT4_DREPO|nr:hypothetical protein DPMN_192586 [Dreissena polymorpha]
MCQCPTGFGGYLCTAVSTPAPVTMTMEQVSTQKLLTTDKPTKFEPSMPTIQTSNTQSLGHSIVDARKEMMTSLSSSSSEISTKMTTEQVSSHKIMTTDKPTKFETSMPLIPASNAQSLGKSLVDSTATSMTS